MQVKWNDYVYLMQVNCIFVIYLLDIFVYLYADKVCHIVANHCDNSSSGAAGIYIEQIITTNSRKK